MNAIVLIKNVKRWYGNSHALNGVNLSLLEREEYVIQGASGSGKSTLLYLLGGLDRPTDGEVIVNNQNLALLSDEDLAIYRNRYVGFVFQFHFLLPSMNCLDNILLPTRLGDGDLAAVKEQALVLSKILEVEHCLKKYPFELSGGEQQRVNIIRALSMRPKLLLCDEPTGNLDSENSQKVIYLLRTLAKDFGATLVIVTHDPLIALNFKEKIHMKDGILVTH